MGSGPRRLQKIKIITQNIFHGKDTKYKDLGKFLDGELLGTSSSSFTSTAGLTKKTDELVDLGIIEIRAYILSCP